MSYIELPEKKPYKKERTTGQRRDELSAAYNLYRHVRKVYLAAHPLCEKCLEQGIIRKSEEVHHKRHLLSSKNLQEMKVLAVDMENLEALCRECHMAEHHKNIIDKRFLIT